MKENQSLATCDPASAPLQSQTSPPHRILVVEDDVFIRQLNTEVLTGSGYEVDNAPDGAAAWQALSTDSYDLVITDNNMPKVTGVELLGKLRAAHMVMPVIMATGTLPTQELSPTPWLQPAATLLKPYTIEELLHTVKKVLREADSSDTSFQVFVKDNPIPPANEPAVAPRQHPKNSPHRILVVEEDRDLRRLYTEALTGPGYQVDVAADGAAGWEALQIHNYNLLITEHDLPKLTGIELVRRVRAAHMALPVVMAAGRLPTYQLARNPALQLAATLAKPFEVHALLDTVKTVLRETDPPREQINSPAYWEGQPLVGSLQL